MSGVFFREIDPFSHSYFFEPDYIQSISLVSFVISIYFVSPVDQCFYPDKDYYGSDLGPCTKQDDVADCQQLCFKTDKCGKFSYVTGRYNGKHGPSARKNCCLKGYATMPLTDEKGVISGPKVCHG